MSIAGALSCSVFVLRIPLNTAYFSKLHLPKAGILLYNFSDPLRLQPGEIIFCKECGEEMQWKNFL